MQIVLSKIYFSNPIINIISELIQVMDFFQKMQNKSSFSVKKAISSHQTCQYIKFYEDIIL